MDERETKNLTKIQQSSSQGDVVSDTKPALDTASTPDDVELASSPEADTASTHDDVELASSPEAVNTGSPQEPEECYYSEDFEDDDDDNNDEEDPGEDSDIEDNDEDDAIRASRDPNPQLPSTVTVLANDADSKVYLVGTAHFSHESQADVAEVLTLATRLDVTLVYCPDFAPTFHLDVNNELSELTKMVFHVAPPNTVTIQKTQPDVVIVELCESRVHMLHLDEKLLLEEAKNINLQKIKQTIKEIGYVQGIAYLLLLRMSAHIAKELGMAPGGEFRQAYREAKKVPVCKVIKLGDRPIQITMRRVLASLTVWQKVRLVWHLMFSIESIKYSKEEIEKCKDRDLLEQMLKDMAGEFPALAKVVVEERDTYLAYSLKNAAFTFREYQRKQKANSHPVVVVGVVGIGHVPGIVSNWEQYRYDLKEITTVPGRPVSLIRRTFGWAFKMSLVGAVGVGCYRLYRWTLPMMV